MKFAIRQVWRQPLFTLTAVLTLGIGIGIGVNTVAFAVVNGLLFKSAYLRVRDGWRPPPRWRATGRDTRRQRGARFRPFNEGEQRAARRVVIASRAESA